jgi:uncharacterized membrane-anchored protein
VVVALKYFTKISAVVLFWVAFVLTRPFGATLGDLLTKSHEGRPGLRHHRLVGAGGVLLVMIVARRMRRSVMASRRLPS